MTNTVTCKKCGLSTDSSADLREVDEVYCGRCGDQLTIVHSTTVASADVVLSDSESPPPKEFDGYELIERIGQGGMGEVWKARKVSLSQADEYLCAIKFMKPELSRQLDFRDRFEHEAAALVRLRKRQDVVGIIDRGETDETFYIVMDYIEGPHGPPLDLKKMLSEGPLLSKVAQPFLLQICDALGFAHKHGIIHRDIKPQNILVDTDERIKLVDFGIASVVNDDGRSFSNEQGPAGTMLYMAPEQTQDGGSERSDIYSLGIVIHEVLTGRLPTGQPPFELTRAELRHIHPDWNQIIKRCTQLDPELRFDEMDDLAAAVKQARHRKTSRKVPPPDPPLPPSPPEQQKQCPACAAMISENCKECPKCGANFLRVKEFENNLRRAERELIRSKNDHAHANNINTGKEKLQQFELAAGRTSRAEAVLNAALVMSPPQRKSEVENLLSQVHEFQEVIEWECAEYAFQVVENYSVAERHYNRLLKVCRAHPRAQQRVGIILQTRRELESDLERYRNQGNARKLEMVLDRFRRHFPDEESTSSGDDVDFMKSLLEKLRQLEAKGAFCEMESEIRQYRQIAPDAAGDDIRSFEETIARAFDGVPEMLDSARQDLCDARFAAAARSASAIVERISDHSEAKVLVTCGQVCAKHLGDRGQHLRNAIASRRWSTATSLLEAVRAELGTFASQVPSLVDAKEVIGDSIQKQSSRRRRLSCLLVVLVAVALVGAAIMFEFPEIFTR